MNQSNHILFLMAIGPNIPTGGLKVVYEYADRLVRDGSKVSIAFAAYFDSTDKTLSRKIRSVLKYVYAKVVFRKHGYTWFIKHEDIKEYFVWKLDFKKLPTADYYIATSVNTAPYVASFPVEKSKKLYFIQGYEAFVIDNEQFIKNTYRFPLKKIVISNWLKKLVEEEGEQCTVVPNGFDSDSYKLTIPIEEKDKHLVSMLYHINVRKDVGVGMKAVELAREEIPELHLVMFGAYQKPDNLPDWVTYYRRPSKELHLAINNSAAIYVGSSKIEGWGLTVGEAMMCGQAVVCTDIDGYKEMATDGNNALLSPAGDSVGLANNIKRLVNDDNLRFSLAKKGMETIKEFEIENSYRKFRNCIFDNEN